MKSLKTRLALLTLLLGSSLLGSPAAQAGDPVLGALIGGGVGSVIGSATGGRSGAVVGGIIGSVAGVAIASEERREYERRYDPSPAYDSTPGGYRRSDYRYDYNNRYLDMPPRPEPYYGRPPVVTVVRTVPVPPVYYYESSRTYVPPHPHHHHHHHGHSGYRQDHDRDYHYDRYNDRRDGWR